MGAHPDLDAGAALPYLSGEPRDEGGVPAAAPVVVLHGTAQPQDGPGGEHGGLLCVRIASCGTAAESNPSIRGGGGGCYCTHGIKVKGSPPPKATTGLTDDPGRRPRTRGAAAQGRSRVTPASCPCASALRRPSHSCRHRGNEAQRRPNLTGRHGRDLARPHPSMARQATAAQDHVLES